MTNDQNGDCENKPNFPADENWLGFRSGNLAHCGLQTVFSVTQSDHSIIQAGPIAITDIRTFALKRVFKIDEADGQSFGGKDACVIGIK